MSYVRCLAVLYEVFNEDNIPERYQEVYDASNDPIENMNNYEEGLTLGDIFDRIEIWYGEVS